jgi:hypothetical protein
MVLRGVMVLFDVMVLFHYYFRVMVLFDAMALIRFTVRFRFMLLILVFMKELPIKRICALRHGKCIVGHKRKDGGMACMRIK